MLVAIHRGMHALAPPACVTVKDETAVDARFYNIHEGMMYHAVPKRRRGDLSLLAFLDGEKPVSTWRVGQARQFILEAQ